MIAPKRHDRIAPLNVLPTAVGAITRAAHACALRSGLDPRPILKRAGLTPQQITNLNSRIDVASQVRFLNLVADALDDECLGIRLAQSIELRELGLLYYVQASSATLGDALARAARYSSIQNEGVRLTFRRDAKPTMSFEYVGVRRISDRHHTELLAAFLVRLCRQLTGRKLIPSHVSFIHRRKPIPADIKSFFGCDIAFGAEVDEIAYSRPVNNIALVGTDPYLNALLLRYCDEAIANRRKKSSPWQIRVENAIAPLLPHGQAHLGQTCQKLGISQRTLVRRLASERQTFSSILERLRYDLAKRYLREPGLPVSEIAWLLGYRSIAAFSHAFKRWTGMTPSEARG